MLYLGPNSFFNNDNLQNFDLPLARLNSVQLFANQSQLRQYIRLTNELQEFDPEHAKECRNLS